MKITETPESAVGNLAIALGFLMADGKLTEPAIRCYVESVCVLAHKADAIIALTAFDTPETKKIAYECLEALGPVPQREPRDAGD